MPDLRRGEKQARAEKDFLKGDSVEVIAVRYGVTVRTVYRWAALKHWGQKARMLVESDYQLVPVKAAADIQMRRKDVVSLAAVKKTGETLHLRDEELPHPIEDEQASEAELDDEEFLPEQTAEPAKKPTDEEMQQLEEMAAEDEPKPEPIAVVAQPQNVTPIRKRFRSQIDELEVIENAIVSTDLLFRTMTSPDQKGFIDTKGIGSTASALVRLLEYRRRINPPTVLELAELAIELNVKPEDFVKALREKWRLRA